MYVCVHYVRICAYTCKTDIGNKDIDNSNLVNLSQNVLKLKLVLTYHLLKTTIIISECSIRVYYQY